jgi:DNA (cytosine-5)-methyltransferase 1
VLKIEDKYRSSLNEYSFIDLFAGIGGFHYAMSSFGAKCVFASEWDAHAADSYQRNLGMLPLGDITQIANSEIPPHDILCGGFPCQAFSISGKQKGFEDSRGTLFFEIARIIDYHKPKILILENVKNFVKHDEGKTLKATLDILNELGYDVFYKVLNASGFGLPQNRERVFIICFRKNLNYSKFSFPKPFTDKIALEEILEKEQTEIKYIDREDIQISKEFVPEENIFGEIVLPNKPIQIGKVNKGGQGERIYHILGHSITLSAYGGGVGAKTGLYKVNGSVRKLTPRECARLQGFPEEYKLPESKTQAYKQFGNSVAINVVQSIIISIIKAMNNE